MPMTISFPFRKHEDDRRFMCPVEGCGKSFTRAEHLKGHSITHLGTKPFECPVEGIAPLSYVFLVTGVYFCLKVHECLVQGWNN